MILNHQIKSQSHEYHILRTTLWPSQRQCADFFVVPSFTEEMTNFIQFDATIVVSGVFDAKHINAKSCEVNGLQNWKLGSLYVQYHEINVADTKCCHDRVQSETLDVRLRC